MRLNVLNLHKRTALAALLLALVGIASVGAFEILTPEALKTSLGTVTTTEADFAPKASEAGITGDIFVVEGANEYGCNAFDASEHANLKDKIVIVKRGFCMFSSKAINIHDAGGLVALVENSDDNLITMITAPFHYGGVVKIPTLMIKKTDGDTIRATLATGTASGKLQGTRLIASEYQAISDFFVGTDGANWKTADGSAINGWTVDPVTGANTGEDPCLAGGYGWRGISCLDGRIVTISMESFNINGPLPKTMGSLTKLKQIYLSYNGISGSIPTEFGSLTSLTELDLSNNEVSGEIPTSFCSITTFTDFRLSNNQLTGTIPDCIGTSWGTGPPTLRLNGNKLSGTIPANLASLTAITELLLSQNALTGSFPTWITQVKSVDIGQNKLSGSIPALNGAIETLKLAENEFSGTIDDTFNSLAGLVTLEAAKNQFTGAFPTFAGCPEILKIDLAGNKLTSWNAAVDFTQIPKLETLNLNDNGLECVAGSVSCFPSSFSNLANLRTVYMNGNKITGSAQLVLGAFLASSTTNKNLQTLDISNNEINGVMRGTIHVWDAMQEFRIANNSLTGPVPSLPQSAAYVDLSGNDFEGNFMDTIQSRTYLTKLSAKGMSKLKTEVTGVLPAYAEATNVFVKDTSGTFSCPRIIITNSGAELDVDPTYYSYSLCKCEKGYYPDPAPPTCTPFPSEVVQTTPVGTVTDGSSTGRIRDGLDTKWKINAGASVKTIALTVKENKLNTSAAGILNVHEGSSVLSPLVYQPRATDVDEVLYVFGNNALLHFTSEGTNGPYFEVTYTTSDTCPPGYSYDTVADKCAPASCPVGHYFARDENNEKKCFPCAMNTYQDEINTGSTCKQCPANSYTSVTGVASVSGCVCGDGYVGALGSYSTKCKSCLSMSGVQCSGTNMTVSSGYYKPPASYEVHDCTPKKLCKAGENMQYLSETTCKTGAYGPKCAICKKGYYSIAESGCQKCGAKGGAIFSVILMCIGVIFLYCMIFKYDITSGSATAKIVLSFMQILHMHLLYKFSWPDAFKEFLSIFGFIQFDFTDLATPSCAFDSTVDFFTSFSFYMALIPVEAVVVMLHYFIYTSFFVGSDAKAQKVVDFRSTCFRNALWMTTFSYPSVASKALQYFRCEKIGGIDFLVADYQISCDSDYYKNAGAAGIIFTIAYVVLFPLGLLALLMLVRKNKTASTGEKGEKRGSVFKVDGQEVVAASRIAFLTGDYTDECFYWEIIDMLRKLSVSVVAIFVSEKNGANMLLTLLISSCYLQSLFLYKPYTKGIDLYTSIIAGFGLMVSLMGGLAIAIEAATSEDFGVGLVVVNVFSILCILISSFLGTYSNLTDYDLSLTALVKERLAFSGPSSKKIASPDVSEP